MVIIDEEDDFEIWLDDEDEPLPTPPKYDFEKWEEKYRPKRLMEVYGYDKIKDQLATFVDSWLRGVPEHRAITLIGKNGIGKTTFALSLGETYGIRIVEFDVSKAGRLKELEELYDAVTYSPIDESDIKILVIDEADNLKRQSRDKMTEILMESNYPMIFIGNEEKGIPRGVKDNSLVIRMRSPDPRTIVRLLRDIAGKEEIEVGDDVLKDIAKKTKEFRAAINVFYLWTNGEIGDLDEVDEVLDIFELTEKILRGEETKHWEEPGLLSLFLMETALSELNDFDRQDVMTTLSLVDELLGGVAQTNYRPWKWAMKILRRCRPIRQVQGLLRVQHAGMGKRRIILNKDITIMKSIRKKLIKQNLVHVNERDWIRTTCNQVMDICKVNLEIIKMLKYDASLTDAECVFLYGEKADFSIEKSARKKKKKSSGTTGSLMDFF